MNTTQIPAQEQPAQPILSETPRPEPQPASTPEQQTAPRRYNPSEAAQIVRHFTDDFFDPEYILLFGKLAGGTPQSDAATYDLLVVVRQTPEFDWMQAKHCLRYRMPVRHREIIYINLYITPLNQIQSNKTPFLYFAHAEGELLYCNPHYCFRHPKRVIDFARAYADARFHFDAYRALGHALIEQAQDAWIERRNMHLAALFAAQAAVYFYHTLYYVFHGQEFDSSNLVTMHQRMRTLSAPLMLALSEDFSEGCFTLPALTRVLSRAPYYAEYDIPPKELEVHLRRVEKLGEIIEQRAGLRLKLYERLSREQ